MQFFWGENRGPIRFRNFGEFLGNIRQNLREEGFRFCDDGQEEVDIEPIRQEEFHESPELRLRGITASSTDFDSQTIQETEKENGEHFWSSTGDASPEVNESLLYEIDSPCSKCHAIGLHVYRAQYQHGSPIYPPRYVAFSLGMHPSNMSLIHGLHPVQPVHTLQVFVLPPEAPPAKYIKVHLCGKVQQQREDRLYYVAVRQVILRGQPLDAESVKEFQDQLWLSNRRSLSYVPRSEKSRKSQYKVERRGWSGNSSTPDTAGRREHDSGLQDRKSMSDVSKDAADIIRMEGWFAIQPPSIEEQDSQHEVLL